MMSFSSFFFFLTVGRRANNVHSPSPPLNSRLWLLNNNKISNLGTLLDGNNARLWDIHHFV